MASSALALASDRQDLSSYSTLPRYVRLKSQSLCKYLTVSDDGKGRLTFSGKMNQVDPHMVFETVHVHAPDKPQPNGRNVVKIKALATNKFWKRIANTKVPECRVPKDAREGVGGLLLYNVVMAIANSEADADVFEYETQQTNEGGAESKMVTLWSPVNKRFLAPVNVIQSTVTHKSIDFVGCISKEKSWKESILIAEGVLGPGKVIWPLGISSESALANFLLLSPVEPRLLNDDRPKPVIDEASPACSPRKLSVQALESAAVLNDSTDPASNKTKVVDVKTDTKYKAHALSDDSRENAQNKKKKGDEAVGGTGKRKDDEDKKAQGKPSALHDGESGGPGAAIRSIDASKFTGIEVPRKLTKEEMAVVFSDSPDVGNSPDLGVVENINRLQSYLISYMNDDWAKDWVYSLSGENKDGGVVVSVASNATPSVVPNRMRCRSVMAMDDVLLKLEALGHWPSDSPGAVQEAKEEECRVQQVMSEMQTIHSPVAPPVLPPENHAYDDNDLGVHGAQIYTVAPGAGLFYDHVGNKARDPKPDFQVCLGERPIDPLSKPHHHCNRIEKKRPVIIEGSPSSWRWDPNPVKVDRTFIDAVYAATAAAKASAIISSIESEKKAEPTKKKVKVKI